MQETAAANASTDPGPRAALAALGLGALWLLPAVVVGFGGEIALNDDYAYAWAVRTALESEDLDTAPIQSALDDLNTTLMKVGERVYGQQQASAEPGSESPPPEDDDTVEGEFREV